MNKLIAFIEKGKPFFEKLSRNIYLRAIRDGFIAGMPVYSLLKYLYLNRLCTKLIGALNGLMKL